jgi:hypothetical protein
MDPSFVCLELSEDSTRKFGICDHSQRRHSGGAFVEDFFLAMSLSAAHSNHLSEECLRSVVHENVLKAAEVLLPPVQM